MEEGKAETTPLIVEEKKLDNNGQDSNSSSTSSVTFVVVFSTLVVCCGSFACGNIAGYSSPAQSGIVKDLGLTVAEFSTFVSNVIVGTIFGAAWSGKIADVIGRRGALGVSSLIISVGWLGIAFAKGAWCLDVGRFLLGCGFGIQLYAAPVYISEISSNTVRGTFMSLTSLPISFGNALFFFVGSFINWRTLAVTGLIPCVLQLIGLFFIPESPRWLMKIGRAEEFENALNRLRGEKADISQEIADIKNYTEFSKTISEDGILSLFQKKYASCLIIGLGLVLFQQFSGISGIGFYTNTILQSAGIPSRMGSIVVGITQVLTAILGICLIDRFGRRPLLLISAIGTFLCSATIGLSFFLKDLHYGDEFIPTLALCGLLAYLSFFGLGMGGLPGIISLEILPMNIKGPAGSIINVVTSASCWIISFSFNFIFERSSAGTFFLFAGISGASVFFIWKIVPETKGRTLEEIEASIINVPS